jgi:hypothetical protein
VVFGRLMLAGFLGKRGKYQKKLHPGEKIKIESMGDRTEHKRLKAFQYLKRISANSRLGLYDEVINREDTHK